MPNCINPMSLGINPSYEGEIFLFKDCFYTAIEKDGSLSWKLNEELKVYKDSGCTNCGSVSFYYSNMMWYPLTIGGCPGGATEGFRCAVGLGIGNSFPTDPVESQTVELQCFCFPSDNNDYEEYISPNTPTTTTADPTATTTTVNPNPTTTTTTTADPTVTTTTTVDPTATTTTTTVDPTATTTTTTTADPTVTTTTTTTADPTVTTTTTTTADPTVTTTTTTTVDPTVTTTTTTTVDPTVTTTTTTTVDPTVTTTTTTTADPTVTTTTTTTADPNTATTTTTVSPTPNLADPYCVFDAGLTSINGTYEYISEPALAYGYSNGYWRKTNDTTKTFGYDYLAQWWVIKSGSIIAYGMGDGTATANSFPPSNGILWGGGAIGPPPTIISGECSTSSPTTTTVSPTTTTTTTANPNSTTTTTTTTTANPTTTTTTTSIPTLTTTTTTTLSPNTNSIKYNAGNELELRLTDDYYDIDGRAIDFISNDYPALNNAVTSFFVDGKINFVKNVIVISSTVLRLEINHLELSSIGAGRWSYEIRSIFQSGHVATLTIGNLIIVPAFGD